ncbi:MAG: P-II family nitrogen regulator [Nitrosarchaeum sp.]|nr:P-II family nitrogen regulator [Nitrosarchaeum sp.]
MKSVCAIIPEKKLEAVNNAMHKLGITGMTVFNTKGRGKDTPKPNQMGHWWYFSEFGENNTILILSSDDDVPKIIEGIKANSEVGKIIVTDIEQLVDIKSNNRGESAL